MRLIDADEIMKRLRAWNTDDPMDQALYRFALSRILEARTVEAVPVVRCKDCKHYYADPWGYGNCVFEGGVSRRTKDSDFCSWGERREDEPEKRNP